jgi:hypothetical protein
MGSEGLEEGGYRGNRISYIIRVLVIDLFTDLSLPPNDRVCKNH